MARRLFLCVVALFGLSRFFRKEEKPKRMIRIIGYRFGDGPTTPAPWATKEEIEDIRKDNAKKQKLKDQKILAEKMG